MSKKYKDSFGDRMKAYEKQCPAQKLMPLLPVMVRLDGRSFSKVTKNMREPYDEGFIQVMIQTTKDLVRETNAVLGYTQSDEITLLLYNSRYGSQSYFDGKVHKINSVLASVATMAFYDAFTLIFGTSPRDFSGKNAYFDCRVWNVPDAQEATNAILWRQQDAIRNSVSKLSSSYLSHSTLQNKSGKEKKAMLRDLLGVEWSECPPQFKYGSFIRKQEVPKNGVMRTMVNEVFYPPLGTIANRVAVIFEDFMPIMEPKES